MKNEPENEMSENELNYYHELTSFILDFSNKMKNKSQAEHVRPTVVINTAAAMASTLVAVTSWFMDKEEKEKFLEHFKKLYYAQTDHFESQAEEVMNKIMKEE